MDVTSSVHLVKPLVKGLSTWIPFVHRAFYDQHAGGSTGSAAYCYGVWLKHLSLLWQHGMDSMPETVLELGPGASLGTGIAALLSGADSYIAVDAVRYSRPTANVVVLRDLVALFQTRAPRPAKAWPDYDKYLDSGLFPSHILTQERLRRSLAPERVATLAAALSASNVASARPAICYRTWSDADPLGVEEVSLVFSHSVMQHVTDLDNVYRHCRRWLKPGGWVSHQIDLSSHGITDEWNGHYLFGERLWTLVAGHRPYFINREPCSTHLRILEEHGFELVSLARRVRSDGLPRTSLAPRWQRLSDDDLGTEAVFVVARKRP